MHATVPPPPYLSFDASTRRLRLDPHEPGFFQNPYEAYAWLHAQGSTFFWEEFGFWCFGGFDDVNRLLRDRRFGRQSPVGIPDSRGVASRPLASRKLRRDRGEFDAGTGAARPHAAAHAGQPRLRLAAGRAAAAARRGAGERADRRFPPSARRSICCRPSPRRCRSPSSPKCSACRSRWGRNCSTGRTRWWRCTCMAARARPRRRPTARRASFRDFLRGYVAERREEPGDDLLSLLIAARDERPEAHRGRTGLVGDPAAQRRPRGDGAPDRQRGARDPRCRAATPAASSPRRKRPPRRSRNACASTRRCICSRAMPMRRSRLRRASASNRARQIGLLLGMANRDPRAFADAGRLPARTAPTRRTSRSAPASISASARRWRGWSCRSR